MADSAAAPDLATLQRWLSLLVRDPRPAVRTARSRTATRLVPARAALRGAVVVPSATMDPMRRVDVYGGGYLARLVEALHEDFKGLAHALGDGGFHDLVAGYVGAHPSRHANLIFLCRRMPEFIAGRRELEHRAFLRDLARVEVAMVEAFHAPAVERFDLTTLQGLAPEQWERLVLRVDPSLRLVATAYPISPYLQAVFEEREAELPARQNAYLAVYRKEFKVWRARLTRSGFLTLAALARGEPFGAALAHAGRDAARVGAWFQDWAADGLFCGAELAD